MFGIHNRITQTLQRPLWTSLISTNLYNRPFVRLFRNTKLLFATETQQYLNLPPGPERRHFVPEKRGISNFPFTFYDFQLQYYSFSCFYCSVESRGERIALFLTIIIDFRPPLLFCIIINYLFFFIFHFFSPFLCNKK